MEIQAAAEAKGSTKAGSVHFGLNVCFNFVLYSCTHEIANGRKGRKVGTAIKFCVTGNYIWGRILGVATRLDKL